MSLLIRRKNIISPDIIKTIAHAFWHGRVVHGPDLNNFVESFKKLVPTQYALTTACGIEAFQIILRYYRFSKNDILLIPAYTSYVIRETLELLEIPFEVVDVLPERATMNPRDLEKKITSKVKGILITHLLGNSCEWECLEIAKKHNLIIIEDCAHAHGVKWQGQSVGIFSHAAFFSFDYCKLINTFTGGMLTTNDEDLFLYAQKIIQNNPPPTKAFILKRIISGYFENIIFSKYFCSFFSLLLKNDSFFKKIKKKLDPYRRGNLTQMKRYSNLQAILGIKQLSCLKEVLQKREQNALFMKDKTKNPQIRFIERRLGDVYYYFIARTSSPEHLKNFLLSKGIDSGIKNSIMDEMTIEKKLKGLEEIISSYIQIPIYSELTEDDLLKIVNALNKYKRHDEHTYKKTSYIL